MASPFGKVPENAKTLTTRKENLKQHLNKITGDGRTARKVMYTHPK
jgi:ribosomal protein S15P/S13E